MKEKGNYTEYMQTDDNLTANELLEDEWKERNNNKTSIEVTHKRYTFLIHHTLDEHLEERCRNQKRGYKTFFINKAVEMLLENSEILTDELQADWTLRNSTSKINESFKRSTFLLDKGVGYRLNYLCADKKRGYQTLFMNKAIEALLINPQALNTLQSKWEQKSSDLKMEDTFKRTTFLLNKEVGERLDEICSNRKHGYKTFF